MINFQFIFEFLDGRKRIRKVWIQASNINEAKLIIANTYLEILDLMTHAILIEPGKTSENLLYYLQKYNDNKLKQKEYETEYQLYLSLKEKYEN